MKKLAIGVLTLLLMSSLAACGLLENAMETRRQTQASCSLDENDTTHFSHSGIDFVILSETVDEDALGDWVGYVQKLAFFDEQGHLLAQLDWTAERKLIHNLPDSASYTVSVGNIYTAPQHSKNALAIGINADYHVALPAAQAGDNMNIISYEKGTFFYNEPTINSNNCSQILLNNNVYQITDTQVEQQALGLYIGFLNEQKLFDAETLEAIPQKEWGAIDITPGELSAQNRIYWQYGLVYGIQGTDNAIAVEINNMYLQAVML